MRLIVLKERAVTAIRARFRNQVYLAADDTAKFRRKNAAHHLDFFDGVDAHDIDIVPVAVLGDAALFGVGIGVRAIHADARPARAQTVDARAAAGADIDSGRKPQNAADVAAGKRKFGHLLGFECLRLFRGSRTHQRRHTLDAHGVGKRAHFEPESLADTLSRHQGNIPAFKSLEALRLNAQRVGADAEKIETEFSGSAAEASRRSAGVLMD